MAVTFSPLSILAYVCGTAASAAASSNPVTAVAAEEAKAMVEALFGGVEIAEGEKNMQSNLFQAMSLSLPKSTDYPIPGWSVFKCTST